jgi:hypothetical protein
VRAQFSHLDGFNVPNVEIKDSSASANGRDGFRCVNSMLLDSTAFRNYSSGVSGGVCGAGRTMAIGNKGGDITGTCTPWDTT